MTEPFHDARSVIDWIHGARTFSEKHGLRNMRAMLQLLGNPERRFKSVHVAGTNGKGSVCAFVERALRQNGYKTGLYTSPYLVRYQERMRLCGTPVKDEVFIQLGNRVYEAAQRLLSQDIRPTAFELGTALAFLIFAEQRVDIAVIEVGLGGRLDPTNVITPDVCAITNIGLDHMDILGDTIEQIAFEKAGIIKPGVPAALYPASPGVADVIMATCDECESALLDAGQVPLRPLHEDARGARFWTDIPALGELTVDIRMAGRHQVLNAQLALCSLSLLSQRGFPLDKDRTLSGIALAEWPGRLQWVTDHLLLDGAHNEQGAQALADYIGDYLPGRRIVLLTAMMKDKRPGACAKLLAPLADHAVATQVQWPRALPAEALAGLYLADSVHAEAQPDIASALRAAQTLAGTDGIVVVCGSLYLVGGVLGILGIE